MAVLKNDATDQGPANLGPMIGGNIAPVGSTPLPTATPAAGAQAATNFVSALATQPNPDNRSLGIQKFRCDTITIPKGTPSAPGSVLWAGSYDFLSIENIQFGVPVPGTNFPTLTDFPVLVNFLWPNTPSSDATPMTIGDVIFQPGYIAILFQNTNVLPLVITITRGVGQYNPNRPIIQSVPGACIISNIISPVAYQNSASFYQDTTGNLGTVTIFTTTQNFYGAYVWSAFMYAGGDGTISFEQSALIAFGVATFFIISAVSAGKISDGVIVTLPSPVYLPPGYELAYSGTKNTRCNVNYQVLATPT